MWALEAFKKAARQDGKCTVCEQQVINLGIDKEDYKTAMSAGARVLTLVHNPSGHGTLSLRDRAAARRVRQAQGRSAYRAKRS